MHVYWKIFNCFKIAMLPKAIYRCNTLPVKILTDFFVDERKFILKVIWKYKEPE